MIFLGHIHLATLDSEVSEAIGNDFRTGLTNVHSPTVGDS